TRVPSTLPIDVHDFGEHAFSGEHAGDAGFDPLLGGGDAARSLVERAHAQLDAIAFSRMFCFLRAHRQDPTPTQIDPSLRISFFQIGTSCFRRSIAWRQASNAAARCGLATEMTTDVSPTSSLPVRCTIAALASGQRVMISSPIARRNFSAIDSYA